MEIKISDIVINGRKRPVDQNRVKELSLSMEAVGLISPIIITDHKVLVAGLHRLEAARLLGWETINVITTDPDPDRDSVISLREELMEIDENLVRNNLTKIEEGLHLVRREEIFVALDLPSQKIRSAFEKPKGEMSESTKALRKRVAKNIDDEVIELLKDTKLADNQVELLKLAKLNKAEQQDFINQFNIGVVNTVDEYLANKKTTNLKNIYLPEIYFCDYLECSGTLKNKSVDLMIAQPNGVASKDYITSVLNSCLPKVKNDGRCFLFIDPTPEVVHGYLNAYYEKVNKWGHLDLCNIMVWTFRNFEHESNVGYFADNIRFVLHIAGQDVDNLKASGTSLSSLFESAADQSEYGAIAPENIINRIIQAASDEDSFIVDPFMKNDAVVKVSALLKRKSMGFTENIEDLHKFTDRGYRVHTDNKPF